MVIILSGIGRSLMLVAFVWLLGIGLLATSNSLRAADTLTPRGAVSIDRSEQFLLRSEKMGDDYRIDIMLPIGYADSQDRYPVVYITDSNYLFYPAAASQLAQVTGDLPSLILVGIGYNVPGIPDTGQIRFRDLAPTCDKAYQKSWSVPDEYCQGTADEFLAFLQDELKPFVNERYRTNPDDETLVGYSLGGIFSLHVLFTHPEAFDRYVAGSPGIRWDDELLLEEERKYAANHDDLDKFVHISAGGLEDPLRIANVHVMYSRLKSRKYPGLKVDLDILENETHNTGINAAVMKGLRSVMGN